MKLGGTGFEHLFEKAMSEDSEVRVRALPELLEFILDFFLAEGEFDITHWNRLAVEVTVDIWFHQNRGFRFKKEDKTIMREMFAPDHVRYIEEPW